MEYVGLPAVVSGKSIELASASSLCACSAVTRRCMTCFSLGANLKSVACLAVPARDLVARAMIPARTSTTGRSFSASSAPASSPSIWDVARRLTKLARIRSLCRLWSSGSQVLFAGVQMSQLFLTAGEHGGE